jgi:hypothetical protein
MAATVAAIASATYMTSRHCRRSRDDERSAASVRPTNPAALVQFKASLPVVFQGNNPPSIAVRRFQALVAAVRVSLDTLGQDRQHAPINERCG